MALRRPEVKVPVKLWLLLRLLLLARSHSRSEGGSSEEDLPGITRKNHNAKLAHLS